MITIKSKEEIELMRKAGNLVSLTHKYLKEYIKPGITTIELDRLAEEFIIKNGGVPTCKGYQGFPNSLCVSVNDEVVHGIPKKRKLKNGDIVTIDMVIGYHGYQGDAAWTYAVGNIDDRKKYLMEHTEKSLYEGLKMVKPGNRIGDISNAIEKYANSHNLGIVKELVGHGIGREMHEDPQVPNYGRKGTGTLLKKGMCLAIEPMITQGERQIVLEKDGWTVRTRDRKLAAHFEHTVAVGLGRADILSSFEYIEQVLGDKSI